MLKFETVQDIINLEKEASFSDRLVDKTIYKALKRVADNFPSRPAISFQISSKPGSSSETYTWNELYTNVVKAANLFRKEGIGKEDVIAFVLPMVDKLQPARQVFQLRLATYLSTLTPLNSAAKRQRGGVDCLLAHCLERAQEALLRSLQMNYLCWTVPPLMSAISLAVVLLGFHRVSVRLEISTWM